MFKYCVIRPNNRTCGGNPTTDEKAAKKYSEFPTAVCVEKNSLALKKIKFKHKKFFRKVNENSKHYTVDFRKTFDTLEAATKHLLNEAKMCGHFLKSDHGWIKFDDDNKLVQTMTEELNNSTKHALFLMTELENSKLNTALMKRNIEEIKKTISYLKNLL